MTRALDVVLVLLVMLAMVGLYLTIGPVYDKLVRFCSRRPR